MVHMDTIVLKLQKEIMEAYFGLNEEIVEDKTAKAIHQFVKEI